MTYLKKLAEHWTKAEAFEPKYLDINGKPTKELSYVEGKELGKDILDIYTRIERIEKRWKRQKEIIKKRKQELMGIE